MKILIEPWPCLISAGRSVSSVSLVGSAMITDQSGVILPRGTDDRDATVYGFLHQTFTEYLAGVHLANLWLRDPLGVLHHAHLPHWREVILLAAGHMGMQSPDMAGGLVQAVADLGSTPWEARLHRDLLLACGILADGVGASPGARTRELLRRLIAAHRAAVAPLLRRDLRDVIEQLGATEYRDVLIDIATQEPKPASCSTSPRSSASRASRRASRRWWAEPLPHRASMRPSSSRSPTLPPPSRGCGGHSTLARNGCAPRSR